MDVEKTIQFFIDNQPNHDAQLGEIKLNMIAIERSLLILGDGLIDLTAIVQKTTENHDRVHAESYERDAKLDEQARARIEEESRARDAKLDASYQRLADLIADFIRAQSARPGLGMRLSTNAPVVPL